MGKNQAEVLFKKYKLFNDESAFEELYNLLEPLLKKVITDVTFIYDGSIVEKQKYSKIHNIEANIGKKLSISTLMENYKDEYICMIGYEDHDRYFKPKYSLVYPFWELINKLSFDKVSTDMSNWKISFEWYLATKFCDNYWLYIERCFRRDFPQKSNSKPRYLYEVSYEDYIKNNDDSFYIKTGFFSELDTLVFSNTLIEELRENLSKRERQMLNLLILGYSSNEICDTLKISHENTYRIKSSIKKKLISISEQYN